MYRNQSQNKDRIDHDWWKSAVIYQIYTRSFYDTNDDGVGDLKGIIQKLDYLQELGVDAIWLTPFFVSPMDDFGYDVAEYTSVDPLFGTNRDMLDLINECHKRDLKVIFDLVLNHTSSQHPWFIESSSSLTNPKRDWYTWNETVPNNWESIFNGTAWEYSPETKEFYYHTFLPSQPDLNLRNPDVISEICKIIKYFLEIGVDGFRLDAINTYYEDKCFENNLVECPADFNPLNCFIRNINTFDQNENFEFIDIIKTTIDCYSGKVLIGEVNKKGPRENEWKKYYGSDLLEGVDLASNFDLLYQFLNFETLVNTIKEWESLRPQDWPSYALSSHDQIRFPSRISSTKLNEIDKQNQIKLFSTFLLTVRGTPFVYYGDELGLDEVSDLTHEQIRDPFAIRNHFTYPSRDGCRTPMLWDDSKNSGFSEANDTWLPIHSDFAKRNIQSQKQNPGSIYNHYKNILKVRKQHKPLQIGTLDIISEYDNVLKYRRVLDGQIIYVILNLSENFIPINTENITIISSNLCINNIVSPLGYAIYEK